MSNISDIEQIQAQITFLNSQIDNLEKAKAISDTDKGGCPFSNHSARQETPKQQPQYIPDFNIPLLAPGGGEGNSKLLAKLGPLKDLIGTWVSERQGGYNVMPIPEATAPNGFILKNFYYYEVITFSAINGKVANRGGDVEQDSYTLFYEQRVFFAEGPQKDQLVHAENGAWLHLIKDYQGEGILDNEYSPKVPNTVPITKQALDQTIVKQVSVPHGNSILAMGGFQSYEGAPIIPKANALPIDAPSPFLAPYGSNSTNNPNINPNIVLSQAVLPPGDEIKSTTVIEVDSANNGDIANIPFIKSHTDVTQYTNTFWLQNLTNGGLRLQYSQNISLEFKNFPKSKSYVFPHITANTLYKVR